MSKNKKRKTYCNSLSVFMKRLARIALYNAQNGICHICGENMPADFYSGSLSFDHVYPLSKLDCDEKWLGNTLVCHFDCNVEKDNRDPNGCELIALSAANAAIGISDVRWEA